MDDTIPQDTPQKQCAKCPNSSPATPEFFFRDRHKKDGLYTICKVCCASRPSRYIPKPRKPREIVEGMKRCGKCQKFHPATIQFFAKCKSTKDGFYARCKQCRAQFRNIERERENKARYYQQHKETFSQQSKQYQAAHREEIAIKHRAYMIVHQEKIDEQKRQYNQTERGKAVQRASRHKRKALKKAIGGTLTPQQIQTKLKAQHYACYYCFVKFEKKDGKYAYHLEHTVPLTRTEANPRHDINYVVLSCPTCNLRKHDKLPHEFWEGGRLF